MLFAPFILLLLLFLVLLMVVTPKGFITIGLPLAVALCAAILVDNLPPKPYEEFDRIFGSQNRVAASEIKAHTSFGSVNNFLSFRMRKSQFAKRIQPYFSSISSIKPSKLENTPRHWPDKTDLQHAAWSVQDAWTETETLLHYDPNTETAYAIIEDLFW